MEYEKLPKDFKEKWIEALRSGKYKQGFGELYNEVTESYCCLGVACVISGNPKINFVDFGFIEDSLIEGVPAELMGQSDLSIKLSMMNDGNDKGDSDIPPKSFSEIADWIEENL